MNKAKEQPKLSIKLDTNLKQITVESNVNLEELYKNIKKLLPEGCPFGNYKEYTLVTNNNINWYPYYVYQNQPNWWVGDPVVNTCGTTITDLPKDFITYTNNSPIGESVHYTGTNQIYTDLEQPKEEKGVFYVQIELN